MANLRQLPAQRRSIALLLAVALIAKLLVPVGWMPAFDGHRVTLEMCGGYGPVSPPMATAMKDAADAMNGAHSEHRKHDKAGADQPCGFAALSFALAGPAAPALERLPAMRERMASWVLTVSIGRGLAAPPPPATGPPFLA
jgi:hypothetical protein